MLLLPFERLGLNGLRLIFCLRRALLLSPPRTTRARGLELDLDMLLDISLELDYDLDVIETSNESPVR